MSSMIVNRGESKYSVLVENIEEELGRTVRSLRMAAGLTQEQLARQFAAVGIPIRQNTVAKLENGLRPTTFKEFAALARIFGLTVGELAKAVSPPSLSAEERESMKQEVARAGARLADLHSSLESLQHVMSDTRNEIMEHEMRMAILMRYLEEMDESGEEDWRRISSGELDDSVAQVLSNLHGRSGGGKSGVDQETS